RRPTSAMCWKPARSCTAARPRISFTTRRWSRAIWAAERTERMSAASALRRQLAEAFAPAERTLPAMLARQAERNGDRPLVSAGDVSWTYAETAAIAARTAGTLRAAGIGAGDRVAIICSNRIELLGLLLGCGWLGAVAVPINVASRGAQLQHILTNSGARLL